MSHAGTVYEGEFLRGLRHGKGKFHTSQGHTYIGEYCNDVMEGMGIYSFLNGDEYQGQFAQGQFHGKGAFITKDRRVEGIFASGAYVGPDPDAE